ncbi:hypothetical protein D9M70_418900 [compost metagenome]
MKRLIGRSPVSRVLDYIKLYPIARMKVAVLIHPLYLDQTITWEQPLRVRNYIQTILAQMPHNGYGAILSLPSDKVSRESF